MSCNRENVTWQNEDGTWAIGFWDYYDVGDTFSDDWDYEWDVEYTDVFNFASVGHATQEEARAAWDGANPGGTNVYIWHPENAKDIERFNALAAAWIKANPPQPRWGSAATAGLTRYGSWRY